MARTGLADIRNDLRGMTEAGTADWTAGTIVYFSDEMLDIILDRRAEPFVYQPMEAEAPRHSGSTFVWELYEIEDRENIEATTGGTAVFYIQDLAGGTIASTDYSVDYRNGLVTFNTNTQGQQYYATGYSYDLNGAASDIWRTKANHAATSAFDFSTDNHSVNRSQLYKAYMAQADYYRNLSEEGSGGSGNMAREDTDSC